MEVVTRYAPTSLVATAVHVDLGSPHLPQMEALVVVWELSDNLIIMGVL